MKENFHSGNANVLNDASPARFPLAGADERTPSKAQYFAWIASTNEGSTEAQTLTNLEYFQYMLNTYGMKLDIYALDAGNLDGASGTYERLDGEKLSKQYPEGYRNIVRKAAEIGARFGVWCGPDGFGDTEESAAARRETLVSLCRDHHFALLKCDSVCGKLSDEHRKMFIDTLIECRKYSPDLILLNHRLELKDGQEYATTELWEGEETYVDVLIKNPCTAPHHRAFMFFRGSTPGLSRLFEDHGVCLSSCLDGFADELILQAFGRCLLLAPEIYGNPWLLRDREQAQLARIFNLHRRYRGILIDGMPLDESRYGRHAVARGSESERFLVLGNPSWTVKTVAVTLGGEIGLAPCDEVFVCLHHPYEQVIGVYLYNETITIPVEPFHACLVHACSREKAPSMLTGCRYQVLHEADGAIDRAEILSSDGLIARTDDAAFSLRTEAFDLTPRTPKLLAETRECAVPDDAEALYEATHFAADSDALERQSLRRAGASAIPEVTRAREAFFSQKTYLYRGCDAAAMFDGDPDTFFDGCSRYPGDLNLRVLGGCLRVDFGRVYHADSVRITFFEPDAPTFELHEQPITPVGSFSSDLRDWLPCRAGEKTTLGRAEMPVVMFRVHNLRTFPGVRRRVEYRIGGDLRYLRIPCPPDRIYSVELIKDGAPVAIDRAPDHVGDACDGFHSVSGVQSQIDYSSFASYPHASNLLADYTAHPACRAHTATVRVPRDDWRKGCYLAIALDGAHGVEGAYAAAKIGDRYVGCPDRAPSYPVNAWETGVREAGEHYTYYLPIAQDMTDADIEITVLFCDSTREAFPCHVYLCDSWTPEGVTVTL